MHKNPFISYVPHQFVRLIFLCLLLQFLCIENDNLYWHKFFIDVWVVVFSILMTTIDNLCQLIFLASVDFCYTCGFDVFKDSNYVTRWIFLLLGYGYNSDKTKVLTKVNVYIKNFYHYFYVYWLRSHFDFLDDYPLCST